VNRHLLAELMYNKYILLTLLTFIMKDLVTFSNLFLNIMLINKKITSLCK